MTNKKIESSPDFNDEYQQYGLAVFTDRLKTRLNEAAERKRLAGQNSLPKATLEDVPEEVAEQPFEDSDERSDGWRHMFLIGRDGPKGCAHNVTLIFENDDRWKDVFAENVFTNTIEVLRQPPIAEIEPGDLKDNSVSMIHVWIEQNYEIVVQDSAMKKALITTAAKRRYHPVQDYLNGLPEWDGERRMKDWLKIALGAKNEPEKYLEGIGERFLIGAVRRIMNAPEATKVDNMLIFEGLQGEGKSSLIEALFSPWNGDTPLPLGDKDAFINIKGSWGYEMAEMDSFNKAAASTAKSFLSSHTDNYRPPFGTKNEKFPRQTVFIGSVNHTEYLIDSSGNRRYWPVWGHYIDLDWLRAHREQLWAEALFCCRMGKRHWVDKRQDAELLKLIEYEQALREHPDAWEAALFVWMDKGNCKEDAYTSLDILTEVLEFDARSISKQHEMKLSLAMQKLKWERGRRRQPGGRRPYLYLTPSWAIERRRRFGTGKPIEMPAMEENEVKF
jgi:putative DNA primase/helicase